MKLGFNITIGIALIAATTCMVGCQGFGPGGGGGNSGGGGGQMLTNVLGDWSLSSMYGKDVTSLSGINGRAPSIAFAQDGGVSGFAGVNRFMTKLEPADMLGGKLNLDKTATTMMAGPPEAMQLERDYLQMLRSARSFNIDQAGKLNLSNGSETIASFVRGAAGKV